mgnify:CR=1 FL=1
MQDDDVSVLMAVPTMYTYLVMAYDKALPDEQARLQAAAVAGDFRADAAGALRHDRDGDDPIKPVSGGPLGCWMPAAGLVLVPDALQLAPGSKTLLATRGGASEHAALCRPGPA